MKNLQTYYNDKKTPWGELFYKVMKAQLSEVKGKAVLDFGSGFGIMADILALDNSVIAIDPERELAEAWEHVNDFQQITGGIGELHNFDDASFDVIICHNVLEYAAERIEIISEFKRLLKVGGVLSIVKHNHAGRIMQTVVFENNAEEAVRLLDGGHPDALFGKINYYTSDDLLTWAKGFQLEKVMGVRTFWALQQKNEIKYEPDWQEKMLRVEMKVSEIDKFRDIAFFHHLILKRM